MNSNISLIYFGVGMLVVAAWMVLKQSPAWDRWKDRRIVGPITVDKAASTLLGVYILSIVVVLNIYCEPLQQWKNDYFLGPE